MAIPQSATILHHLRQTMLRQDGAGLTDGQLLRSFLYRGDEPAFEALVRRHGPMVRGVCRRVLRNLDDADDAFQAAFLVLLRKASTLATREVLGDWLHGVAYRTALKARSAAAHRRMKERRTLRREVITDHEDRWDWLPLLDEEVGRLPLKYRLPVVLCDLEGRTRRDAAQQLGWPEGTLSGRLSRARALLARRLTHRGVTVSVAALAAGMVNEASARLPFSLVRPICKTAMEFAAGSASASAHVVALTEGVVKAMFISKLKNVVALVILILILTAGAGAWRYAAVAGQPEEKPVPASPDSRPVAVPKSEEPVSRRVLPKDSRFQIDLRIEREKDGQRKLLASPQLLVSNLQQEASFGVPDEVAGGTPVGRISGFEGMGPSVRVTVLAYYGDKICLDMTVNQPTLGSFQLHDTTVEAKSIRAIRKIKLSEPTTVKVKTGEKESATLQVTAAVRVIEKKPEANTNSGAEKDYQFPEFWRRTANPDSASFYYELILREYRNTIPERRAKQRLAELDEEQPVRVGQIFITGNKRVSDSHILKHIKLRPGLIVGHSDLCTAEQHLSRLNGIKSNAKVTVMDREDDREFKDIMIAVEEK
ncbi:MAG TPA: sigma-70 family RNA polymerase sigma factor [Gemmataceae bacterium]|jgi:RNA polymerase sigma factor (sigma-70 family)